MNNKKIEKHIDLLSELINGSSAIRLCLTEEFKNHKQINKQLEIIRVRLLQLSWKISHLKELVDSENKTDD